MTRVRFVIFPLAVLLVSTSSTAAQVRDSEPNDTFFASQFIPGAAFDLAFDVQIENSVGSNTSTTVPHAEIISTGDFSGTIDYFSFFVTAGTLITLDIDCAFGGDASCVGFSVSFDPELFLLFPGGSTAAFNNDNVISPTALDTGSLSDLDSFLTFTASATGNWTVLVTQVGGNGIGINVGEPHEVQL